MVVGIKNKQDLVKALQQGELRFAGEVEVVNDDGLKLSTEKLKSAIRQKRKLHVVLLERD